ncbi:MAG: hypothetical protein C0624_10760 [Desulfuromonas sp.]|nr:MAG: hypothetical protein C0624_10760 [Desulfuromonas sp.]
MTVYSFSDLHFCLHGQATPVYIAIEEMFQLAPRTSGVKALPLHTFVINDSEPFDMLPDWLNKEVSALPTSAETYMFYGPDGDAATVAKHSHSVSCAWLAPGHDELRFVSRKTGQDKTGLSVACVLVPILREALQRKQKLLMHAAAVQCSDGTGILIQADGGGGKSTTALAMLRNGATLLADDLVIMDGANASKNRLRGFPEYLNLTDQTIAFFPELADACKAPYAEGHNVDLKSRFDPRVLYPQAYSNVTIQLQAIYFVQISADGPTASRLSPSETLSRLIKSHTFALQQKMDPAMAGTLIELAHTVPAYLVPTGPSPDELGKWLNHNSRCLANGDIPTLPHNAAGNKA